MMNNEKESKNLKDELSELVEVDEIKRSVW